MSGKISGIDAISAAPAGFFGNKLQIVCGGCENMWTTGEYAQITNRNNRLAARCPECKKWNITDLVRSES